MRLSLFTVTAIAAILASQAACARQPAQPADPDRSAPAPAAARLPERDDARPAALMATSAADTACSRDPASAIDGAIAITLGAVRGNDAQALLNQIGPDGVDINGTVSPDGLAKQFASRTGRFCDLFNCGGRDGDMHHLFHSGTTDKQVDAANGRASVFINANTNDEVDLSYKWAECKWWLTAIATP